MSWGPKLGFTRQYCSPLHSPYWAARYTFLVPLEYQAQTTCRHQKSLKTFHKLPPFGLTPWLTVTQPTNESAASSQAAPLHPLGKEHVAGWLNQLRRKEHMVCRRAGRRVATCPAFQTKTTSPREGGPAWNGFLSFSRNLMISGRGFRAGPRQLRSPSSSPDPWGSA